jgi:hypothetical protein
MKRDIDGLMTKIGYAYLMLPFFMFCVSWLNNLSALAFGSVTLLSFGFCVRNIKGQDEINQILLDNKGKLIPMFLILVFLIFYSGIGSYTFQNNDHLYRNAMFRDLVKYEWPVRYHVEGFPGHFLDGKNTIMTYYLGFYLPPAALGKLFGYDFGRFAFFVWVLLGTVLVIYQTGKYFKRFNYKLLLLFFGWGTLFFVGAILKYSFPNVFLDPDNHYLWAGMILYADSNLGLIYWTFNQSLTAWLIILLILNGAPKQNILILYTLCFFLSPFAFAGLLPFVIFFIFKGYTGSFLRLSDWWENIKPYLSFQNVLGGGLVLALNYIFISSNQAGKFFQVLHHSPKILGIFYLLSWVLVAIFIGWKYKKDPLFLLAIAVLIPLPFFQQGYGIDFPGRISIPALFILMLYVGKYLIEEQKTLARIPILAYMALSLAGHFTFETFRSMAYTSAEYISHQTQFDDKMAASNNPEIKKLGRHLKSLENKNICIQDLGTLTNPKNTVIWNYMADTEGSRFYRWFAEK